MYASSAKTNRAAVEVRLSSFVLAFVAAALIACVFLLSGCSGGSNEGVGANASGSGDASGSGGAGGSGAGGNVALADEGETSGPAWSAPSSIVLSPYNPDGLEGTPEAGVDTSSLSQGYVCAVGTSDSRLKFQVACGDAAYNYDLPQDGTPIVCPLNMGDGSYTFRIMQNTSGDKYVELFSTSAQVKLESEFEPFIRPSFFCSYDASSAAVKKAAELAAGAANEGDVLRVVYSYIVSNVTYDSDKAAELATQTGYVPNPDETLASGNGICFDYASLAGAMLRSLGIPTKIITGYVSPDGIYHAWNMVYINGSWHTIEISVDSDTWTRVDLTFAASGALDTVGDGSSYEDRYVY